MELLGRVRLLNKLDEKSVKAIDKVIDPPMNAPNSAKNSKHRSSRPNSMFYSSNPREQGIQPQFMLNWDIGAAEGKIDNTKREIADGYYNNLFTALLNTQDDPSKTATEVIKIDEERLAQLGPVLEAIHSEDIGPSVERTFQIMFDNGELPPPPAEMFERKLTIEYSSVVAQAQKAQNVVAQERAVGYIGNVAGINPEVLDVINWDENVKDYVNQLSIEPDQINSDEKIAAIRQGRAQAAQAEQQSALINQSAQSAKLLSETDTSREDSALNQLLGQ